MKNLVVGAQYTIKDSKNTVLATFTADSTTKTINIDQLGTNAGSIFITVKQTNYNESPTTEVKYAAEKVETTLAIAASNVTVTNNFNSKDVITLKNLERCDKENKANKFRSRRNNKNNHYRSIRNN